MFAGNRPAQRHHCLHQPLHRRLGRATFRCVRAMIHDVHVQIAVGQVSERWNGETGFAAQPFEEAGEALVLPHGDGDVLVELGVAQFEHRPGTLAPHRPKLLRGGSVARLPECNGVTPRPRHDFQLLIGNLVRRAGEFNQDDRPPRLPCKDILPGGALRALDAVPV